MARVASGRTLFSRALKKDLVGYAFIAPWLVGFTLFTLGPFLTSVYLSFTRYNIVSSPRWIGLANYQLMLRDATFWRSLWLTFEYALVAVPLGIVAGVGLALLLNVSVRGVGAFRTIFFVPSIVPMVASCPGSAV